MVDPTGHTALSVDGPLQSTQASKQASRQHTRPSVAAVTADHESCQQALLPHPPTHQHNTSPTQQASADHQSCQHMARHSNHTPRICTLPTRSFAESVHSLDRATAGCPKQYYSYLAAGQSLRSRAAATEPASFQRHSRRLVPAQRYSAQSTHVATARSQP